MGQDSIDAAVRARIRGVAWLFVVLFCLAFWGLTVKYTLSVWHHSKAARTIPAPSEIGLSVESK